jgi:hypothetical protein
MSEHAMAWIKPRPEIDPKTTAWHEVACLCGWSRKFVSQYRAGVMFEKHVEDEAWERTAPPPPRSERDRNRRIETVRLTSEPLPGTVDEECEHYQTRGYRQNNTDPLPCHKQIVYVDDRPHRDERPRTERGDEGHDADAHQRGQWPAHPPRLCRFQAYMCGARITSEVDLISSQRSLRAR